MNNSELYDYVRSYLDQDTNTLPDEVMRTMTYAVEGKLNRALVDHPRLRSRQFWITPGGEQRIPLPDRMLQLHTLKQGTTDYTQYPLSLEEKASNSPPSFIVAGDCILVWPTPTDQTTYTMDMSLVLLSIVDPANEAKENWISKYHADVYQVGLLAEAAGFLRDPQSEAVWQQRFASAVEGLRMQGWNETITSIPRVHSA
jgi:hypothetical protein